MTVEDLERVRKSVVRRYSISAGLALHGVSIELDTSVDTAAVVGEKNDKGIIEVKKIVVNPDFFDRLSFSERVFVLAHEAMHIALKHFARSIDKPEKDEQRKYDEYCQTETDENKRQAKRAALHGHYQRIWNIATDACINAFLKKDGFSFPTNVTHPKTGKKMQFVELADGLIKSAEKIYDQLVQKEEQEEKQRQQDQTNHNQSNQNEQSNQNSTNNQQSSENSGDSRESNNSNQESNDKDNTRKHESSKQNNSQTSSIDNLNPDEYDGFDSHEQWTGNSQNEQKDQKHDNQNSPQSNQDEEQIDEEDIFNKELENREKANKANQQAGTGSFSQIRAQNGIGKAVPYKPILSWKRLLTGSLEKTVEVWGNRRASRSNPNPRVEERIIEGLCSIEVILDVSGSVSTELLRGFLLQLYPIFQEVYEEENITMKVGTFSHTFSGFQQISSKKEIGEYRPVIGGGTNFEVAATSFTPDPGREIVKIVFTDGCLGTPQVTRVPDIIWVVFGDSMNFSPVGGRIIHVSEKDYKDMLSSGLIYTEEEDYSRRR